jgi:Ca2+/Na+ antiporter
LALVTQGNYQGHIYGGVTYLSSLIAGFLFPKSKGNLNETASALFLMILLMTFTLAFRYDFIAVPIILVLMAALYLLAKKERRIY